MATDSVLEKKRLSRQLGLKGEVLASVYLQSLGYELLSANYRFAHREIDLIMRQGEVLVFVEVRTRTRGGLVDAYVSVDKRKQRCLFSAAGKYIREKRSHALIRFDIVWIEMDVNGDRLRVAGHIQDAFRPFGD